MFEFTNKETRRLFKATKYGKKVNKTLYISLGVALVLLIVSILVFLFLRESSVDDIVLNILFGITSITIIIVCYFDGKRDGAIKQFELNMETTEK